MKTIYKAAFCVALLAIGAPVQAQDTTYDWTGTGGFDAMITLDSPSSSGGSLSDIVSIYVQDPSDFGPFANYPTSVFVPGFGNITIPASEFDGGTVTLGAPFTWSPTAITSMSLSWALGGVVTLDAGSTFGNSVSYYNGDAGLFESDTTGNWQPPSATPDAGCTSVLFGVALAGLGGFFRFKQVGE